VIHLAALTSVQESIRDPVSTTEVNVVGTLNVLKAAKALEAERVLFASSAAVYGTPQRFPIAEEASISPISPYGASKAASEHYLGSFEENHGIEAASLRFFNVYGPRQTPNQYAGVISIFGKRALKRQPLRVFGDGSQTRDFIYVKDIVSALTFAAATAGVTGTFNAGYGGQMTINELAGTIAAAAGTPAAITHGPERAGDVRHSRASSERLRAAGWQPRFTLAEGLAETLAWFRGC